MTVRGFISRLLALRRRAEIDADLAEEIEEHIRIAAEGKAASGVSWDAAYDAARREFGNPTLARERSRETWSWPAIDRLIADLRFGLRIAAKHRASTLVAIASLGVGIGVTSAVLSLLSSVVSPAYPFADDDRLAVLWARSRRVARFDQMQISMPELRRWQLQATQVSVGGFSWGPGINVAVDRSPPMRSLASLVTSNLLSVLGVSPELGRGFTAEDEYDDAPNAAIVTYDFWQEQLGGTPAALSVPLMIDREPYAVIGVMPRGFHLPMLLNVKVLLPARRAPWVSDRSARSVVAIGRLAPGASLASVGDELERFTSQFNRAVPEDRNAWSVRIQPLRSLGREHFGTTLSIFLALAVLVLLIACANVAILLLARVPARRQELMVRLALGAERRRIVMQLVAESGWLAAGAALIGAAVAPPTMRILFRLVEGSLPFALHPSMNGTVVLSLVLLSTLTCVGFGMAPALNAVRSLSDTSSLIGSRTGGAVAHEWLRSALMAAEVGLAVVVVVGGWLMIEAIVEVRGRQLGFEHRELVTARLLLDTARYRSAQAQYDFYATLATRLAGHGELRDVTVGSSVPLGTAGDFANYVTRDVATTGDKPDTLTVSASVVLPNYFDAMHIPIVAGRMFDGREDEPVVVVNETLARQLWPGGGAVGQRLRILSPMYADGESVKPGVRRIVAVSRAIRYSPTNPEGHWPNLYIPLSQHSLRGMHVAVRAATPAAGVSAIRAEVAALDPLLPVFGVNSIDDLFDYWLHTPYLDALITSVLAGIGALLTIVGIYSVAAVFVAQRTHEIGVRMAVGAQRRDVVRIVLGRTLRPAALGIIAGSGAALLGSRAIASLLYGVSPLEPRAFLGAAVVLIVVVGAAAALPAGRAARLDPLTALRTE